MKEMFLRKNNGKYIIVDSNGNEIFSSVESRWDSMPYSSIAEKKNYNRQIKPYGCTFINENGDKVTKYGYIRDDRVIIKHKFDAVHLFQEGKAEVSIKGLSGFVNVQGISIVERHRGGEIELLVFPGLDLVEPFNHKNGYINLAVCIKDNLFGLVDNRGELQISCEYDSIIYPYKKDCYLELIKDNKKSFALMDGYKGEEYISYITPLGKYIKAERTKNNFYILTTTEHTKTIIDCLGEQYIEDDCSDIIVGDNDLVKIERKGKCGLYRFGYEDAVYFSNIMPEEYDDIYGITEYIDYSSISKEPLVEMNKRKDEQYIAIEKNGYIGIVDIEGNILLPCVIKVSEDICILPHTYGDGMVGFRDEKKDFLQNKGFINDKGNIQIKAQYYSIINGFKNGIAEVIKGTDLVSINKQNKIVGDIVEIYESEGPYEKESWGDIYDAFEGDPDNYWNID